MASRRDWQQLGERQRKRYLAAGRKQGLSSQQVIEYYESGGDLSVWRGQTRSRRVGVSERTWRKLMAAARRSELGQIPPGRQKPVPPGEILESLIRKGFEPDWILDQLEKQYDSRTRFRSAAMRAYRKKYPKLDAGYNPGRSRHKRRNLNADIELYYYH